ncbi:ATP-binding protein [Ferrovibrio sp.]|uniref:hybrid sensor histidine kinase/response regulator n=1 Tax=Ferrovibrio sp. TaxID=1917215 RepID=UPI0035AD8DB0
MKQDELIAAAEADLIATGRETVQAMDALFQPVLAFQSVIIDAELQDLPLSEAIRPFFAVAQNPVRSYPQVNGIYLGYPDGSFLQVQEFLPQLLRAAAGDAIDQGQGSRRVIRRDGATASESWSYRDAASQQWQTLPPRLPDYDPRSRPWYNAATQSDSGIWTDPYIFSSTGKLGVTYASALRRRDGSIYAVLGVDLTLETLSGILDQKSRELAGRDGLIFTTDIGDKVVGHPGLGTVMRQGDADIRSLLARYSDDSRLERQLIDQVRDARRAIFIDHGDQTYIAVRTAPENSNAMPLNLYVARNLTTVTAKAREELKRNAIIALLLAAVMAGVVSYAVKLRLEVAARKRAELRLKNMNNELEQAKGEAEAATKAKSDFLATMSHEIRTPMNGVMSMAEMLDLTRLDHEQKRMTRIINESAQALLTVINDILDFSKIEAGKLDIEQIPFGLGDLVDAVGELLAPRADAHGLELLVDIDPAIAERRLGDPTRIRQVLLNLGSNAVKFTQEGSVSIEVRETAPGLVRFSVSDTGIGLTPAQQAKLFQPFAQADSSTARKFGGTGLGLSICHRLCELMQGRIGVSSEAGKGSCFWFELPLVAEKPDALRPVSDLSAGHVLLVGLPAAQAALAEKYLRAGGVPDVVAVATAAAGEALLRRDFDLVLVDARCPDRPGLDLAGQFGGDAAYGLLAPRNLVSTLDTAQRRNFRLVQTYPLNRMALWRAMAVGLKQEIADADGAGQREDMAFAAPDVETAAAANALILVAEDNQTNQLVIRSMLQRMGFACEIADNGALALAAFQPGRHGLLLTDFHMPEMDGFGLTAAIRKQEDYRGLPRLPIVALTADALTGVEQQCLDAGMDGYLTKPIDSRKLSAMLAQWLPQALPLRRPAEQKTRIPEAAAPEPQDASQAAPQTTQQAISAQDWDPDIFMPARLTETFGAFDATAKELLRNFVDDAAGKVVALQQAAANRDLHEGREISHMLKGSARSLGAERLGQIASDIQDACDANDAEMMALMTELLPSTLDELKQIMPKILAYGD